MANSYDGNSVTGCQSKNLGVTVCNGMASVVNFRRLETHYVGSVVANDANGHKS